MPHVPLKKKLYSQHATQCTTSANMHSHMEEGCFSKKKVL